MPQLDDSRGKRHGRLETAPDPNHRGTTIRHTVRMRDEHWPTSRQADWLRTDIASVESGLSYSAASSIRVSSSNNRSTVRRMCRRAASVAMSTNAVSPSSVRRSC